MAFHFDFEAIKKHPYAIGGAIIAGGLIIFYLLSRGGASSSSSDGGLGEVLSYDQNQAQVQAALAQSQGQQQTQLAQSELEAQVSNTQTQASLEAQNNATNAQLADNIAGIIGSVYGTNAATVNQANEEVYTENVQDMADSVLEDQINSSVYEDANNNAAALAGLEYTTGAETTLASAAQSDQFQLDQGILAKAGQQYNSGGDLESATALEETLASGGNPGVAAEGASGVASVTNTSNTLQTSLANTASGLISKLL